MVTPEAVETFLAAVTRDRLGDSAAPQPPEASTRRRREIAAAEGQLDALGVA
jgi:hypothetical protein